MMSAVGASIGLENLIKAQAYGLGFDLVGITSLAPVETAAAFERWLARGYSGEMEYLKRGAEKRRDSRSPVPGATHAVVVGLNYGGREPAGPIARYARGDDYHELMVSRLDDLRRWLESQTGRPIAGKPYVDTGPILERDLARRAGLGWFGKNTNLVNPQIGSFFFIGALLVDIDLAVDAPFEGDRCGTCTRCLDACPTGALVEPRVLDATHCISYLTIENKGAIPEQLRAAVGEMIYGCDICQDVCPWSIRFSRDLREDALQTRPMFVDRSARGQALEFLTMDDESYRKTFQGSPMKRAKRRGLSRNAAVVLGNVGLSQDMAVLEASRATADEMVREHIDWALERIASREESS
jgi:epoxyqueuosine reductase